MLQSGARVVATEKLALYLRGVHLSGDSYVEVAVLRRRIIKH